MKKFGKIFEERKAQQKKASVKRRRLETSRKRLSGRVERVQKLRHTSIVNSQKLVGGSSHVNVKMFTLCTLLVHELKNRFILWLRLQNDSHNQKERPSQNR